MNNMYPFEYLHKLSKFFVKNKKKKIKRYTKEWLIVHEFFFGGAQYVVPPFQKFNPQQEKKNQYFLGGDKMLMKDKANFFLKLREDNKKNIKNIVELGVLNGSSLAILSKLFPTSKIYGFDIEVSNFSKNYNFFKENGAFKIKPSVYYLDQFNISKNYLNKIFKNKKIDLLIDDGEHSNFSITNSLKFFYQFLNKKFVYIIEDNLDCLDDVKNILKKNYCNFKCKITNKEKTKLIVLNGTKNN